ncbi:MAG: BACON domain-containing protein [Blastocatellia bacterium]
MSATGQRFDVEGGMAKVQLATGSGCEWMVNSNADWIRVLSVEKGTGSSEVRLAVAENQSVAQRTGTVAIAGQLFTVEQAGLGGTCVPVMIEPGPPIWGTWTASDCRATVRTDSVADTYLFNATAGQQVSLGILAFPQSGFSGSAALALIAPDGTLIEQSSLDPFATSANGARLPVNGGFISLPVSGTYRIETSPVNSASLNDYLLNVNLAPGTCTYALSAARQGFEPAGGLGIVNLQTTNDCPWTASSNVSWLTILEGDTGQGNGTISYSVTRNTSRSSRTATLTIGGQLYTVDQAGTDGKCLASTLSPGQAVSGVVNEGDCPSILPGRTGHADRYTFAGASGDQIALALTTSTLTLTLFDPNGQVILSGETSRLPAGTTFYKLPVSGTYTAEVAAFNFAPSVSYTLTLFSSKATCAFNIAPLTRRLEATAAAGTFNLEASGDCLWQATPDVSWITLTNNRGSSNAMLNYAVAANTGNAFRTGRITVGDQIFTVEQAGANSRCGPTPVTPGQAITATIAGGDCPSIIRRNVPVHRYSFTGNAGERVAVQVNSSTIMFLGLIGPDGLPLASLDQVTRLPRGGNIVLPRTGTYVVELGYPVSGIYSFTLNLQTACSFTLSSTSLNLAAGGGTGTLTLLAGSGCDWLASSDADWISIAAANSFGSGTTTLNYSAAPNPGTTPRTATLLIAGQVVTVTQAGRANLPSTSSP